MDTRRLVDLNRVDQQKELVTDLMCALSAQAFGGPGGEAEYFLKAWPRAVYRDEVVQAFDPVLQHKAAVAAGTTTDAAWAAPLMAQTLLKGYAPLVKAASLLGKLPLSPAPFNTRIAKQISGSSTVWVGEGIGKPISKLAYGNVSLLWNKASSIVVVTDELMRLMDPSAVDQLQSTLKNEMVVFIDKEFLSTTAAVPNQRPAGVLAGVTPITATADLAADLRTLVNTFFTNRPYPLGPYVVVSPATASKIAALDLGREVTVAGGTLLGLPVVVSPAAAANAIVLDAPGIYVADAGIELAISKEALIEMVDATTNPPVAATVYQSMFQTNTVAIRCEQFVTWVVAVSNAVQFLAVA